MENCGYCAKAKQVLAPDIASGFVVIKDAKEAKNVGGFPHFVSTTTGATHTGFMADKEKLFEKLGVKQNKQAQSQEQAQAHQQAQAQAQAQAHQQAQAQAHQQAQAYQQAQAQQQAQAYQQARVHHRSKEVENGSSINGGYLSLKQTWSPQKRYVA